MRRLSYTLKLCLAAICIACLWNCTEDIDTSSRYVFTEETILSYLEKHEAYSSYVDILRQVNISKLSNSKVSQLLSARGVYTVFAPNNEAIQKYLEDLVKEGLINEPSWDAFPSERKLDSIRKVIVLNTVIDGGDMEEQRFTVSLITSFGAGKENAGEYASERAVHHHHRRAG